MIFYYNHEKFGKFRTPGLLADAIGYENLNYENLCLTKVSLGDAIDNFKFKRKKNVQIDELYRTRITKLRQTYSHLRLWHSGGKDAEQALLNAEINDINFDEIVTINKDPYYERPEVSKIRVPVHYLKNNLWKELKISDDVRENVFSSKDWWNYTIDYSVNGWMIFYKNFVLDHFKNSLDVFGNIQPIFFYQDNKWHFFFDHESLSSLVHISNIGSKEYYTHGEYFNLCEDMPELLEAYTNRIVDQLEKRDLYLSLSEMTKLIKTKNNQRFFKELLPEYQAIKLLQETDKVIENKSYQNEPWGKIHQSFKEQMVLQSVIDKNPNWFKIYKTKTPWDKINKLHNWGTPITKFYVLE